jgi:hypothetical protein
LHEEFGGIQQYWFFASEITQHKQERRWEKALIFLVLVYYWFEGVYIISANKNTRKRRNVMEFGMQMFLYAINQIGGTRKVAGTIKKELR